MSVGEELRNDGRLDDRFAVVFQGRDKAALEEELEELIVETVTWA